MFQSTWVESYEGGGYLLTCNLILHFLNYKVYHIVAFANNFFNPVG